MAINMVKWQDIYTLSDTTLDVAISTLDKMGKATSYGRVVHVSKYQVIVEQNSIEGVDEGNDYIIIPKGCLREEYKESDND